MTAGQITRLAALTGVALGLSSLAVRSAYLDDGANAPGMRETVVPDRLPGPILPPGHDDPLSRLLRRVEVGRPYGYGPLTVVPLTVREGRDQPDLCTLDEALNRGWITIREQDQARVSEVVVRNESSHPVFLMAGEILGGGRQDRIVRSDVLVRPGSDGVVVPVYCGEQDRWRGERESFDRAPYAAGPAMRGMAARAASQDAIWSEIDRQLKQAHVSAPTRSYQSLYGDRDTGRRIEDVVARFRDLRTRRTVGLVIASRGQVVSGDVFGNADLCDRLWDKIIRSHAVDLVPGNGWKADDGRSANVSPEAVRRFLDTFSRAEQVSEYTPGAGASFALRGGVDGHVLVWNDGLVHAAAFPSEDVRPMPLEPRPYLRTPR